MLIGLVEGTVTATIRHKSMAGWKVLIVQPLGLAVQAEGDPVLAIDMLGAGHGTKVLISNDGKGTREMIGDTTSPVRWSVIGLLDDEG
jgi:ethanolamine utilization protein EutN